MPSKKARAAEDSPDEQIAESLGEEAVAFYRRVMKILRAAELPFLVGGAYAFRCYTGVERDTKDFDFHIRSSDVDAVVAALRREGLRAERKFHWVAKVHSDDDEHFADFAFWASNGLGEVDDSWMQRAAARGPEQRILGVPARLCPPEEMLWHKMYVMERERFDGGDVAHLILRCGETLDWPHLRARFGEHWRLLLCHLVLFGFIYPTEEARCVPAELRAELLAQLMKSPPECSERLCRGPLISRAQYLPDVQEWGFVDARLRPPAKLTEQQLREWTEAIDREEKEKK